MLKIRLKETNSEHRNFVKEQQEDPFTKKVFDFGDVVVVKAVGKEVWLYESWKENYPESTEQMLAKLPTHKRLQFGADEPEPERNPTFRIKNKSQHSDTTNSDTSPNNTISKPRLKLKRKDSPRNDLPLDNSQEIYINSQPGSWLTRNVRSFLNLFK